MGTPHIHCKVIHAWADGAEIEYLICGDTHWYGCSDPSWDEDIRYRIKPTTIKIGSHEVPEPLRVEPATGTEHWVVRLSAIEPVFVATWGVSSSDRYRLECGLVHLTKDAALAHAEALIELSKGAWI